MEILPSFSEDDYSFLIESSYYLETDTNPDQPQPAIGEAYTHLGELALIEKDLLKLAFEITWFGRFTAFCEYVTVSFPCD